MEIDFSTDLIEKLLVKHVLADKSWLNILSQTFDKRWFQTPYISLILKLILNYYKKYNSIPSILIIQNLAKRLAEQQPESNINIIEIQKVLAEISNLNLNIDEKVLSANLQEFIRRQAFYNSFYDNANILDKDPNNYKLVVDKCLENFDKVQKIIFNDTDLGLNYFDSNSMVEHWKYIENNETKIKTGWDSLDEYTNGGFLKDGKMLALFMAQAGLGKSVFLSNLAVNFLKQNLSVVVISLEMSQDVYAQRFDEHISNVDINHLKEHKTTAIDNIKEFYSKYPNANLYIKEYPPRSIRPQDIQIYLENLKNSGKKFDVVIIDYLNLVVPNYKSDSMFKDGLTVSELRALSYIFNCPFISAVQCNTEGMNSEDIDMQHVSESRGIVHTVDFLGALYQRDDDRENGIINMKILKNRLGGRIGKTSNFKLDPSTLVTRDITFDNQFEISDDSNEINITQLSNDCICDNELFSESN